MSCVHDLSAAEVAALMPPGAGEPTAFGGVVVPDGYKKYDLTVEEWREYDFGGRTYRIDAPAFLVTRAGGTTHRVVDGRGVAHCVPAPGVGGCALRWKSKNPHKPIEF